MKLDRNATVAEIYAHPLGRDIIDKMLLQTGRSTTWVRNPLVSTSIFASSINFMVFSCILSFRRPFVSEVV